MKTLIDFYAQCLETEKAAFLKVMRAVPADQLAYKPHERSTSAGDLLWLLATELHDACDLIDRGEANYIYTAAPGAAECIAAYETHLAALQSRLPGIDADKWDSRGRFLVNGNLAWEAAVGDMLFGFHFDAIHHRGQLSSYLRPMGAKVPAIYGPSGDDPGT
jgi:uncharacterized damage-inducible protein DinB